jgi:hypothetical protein
MKRSLALVGIVLLLSSCASMQRSRDQSGMLSVARLIDAGQSGALARLSAVPFLLDQEILLLPADVAAFWKGLVEAGYRLEAPELDRGGPLGPESYKEFKDSMDVRVFFKKYVKPGTRLLELHTHDGRRILLAYRSTLCSRQILGFKGPF